MFDISWSELVILGVVALIVVGPKELPVFLRTLGRYAGMVRRQANEFRTHFDEAMREAEMSELREEMEGVRRDVMKTARDMEQSVAVPPKDEERGVKAVAAVSDEPVPVPAIPAPAAPAPVTKEG